MVSPLIADFIDEMQKDGELTTWTIALIGGGEEVQSVGGLEVNTMKRTPIQSEPYNRYAIKTLISPRDQAIELSEAEWRAARYLTHKTRRGDKDRDQGAIPPDEPRGLAPRRGRGPLRVCLLDARLCKVPELIQGPPVLASAASLPGSPSPRRVSGADDMSNSVLWEAMNDWLD